jgi:hypothetical protein
MPNEGCAEMITFGRMTHSRTVAVKPVHLIVIVRTKSNAIYFELIAFGYNKIKVNLVDRDRCAFESMRVYGDLAAEDDVCGDAE